MSQSSASSSGKLLAITAVLSSLTTAVVSYWIHRRTIEFHSQNWQSRRQEERTGRIRAEVKLRTTLKEAERLGQSVNPDTKDDGKGTSSMTLRVIGKIVSPYTKRMGTPRQPQLVPSSRGYIEFDIPAESVSGIDAFSHIFVIFEFHANTDVNTAKDKRTKIRPPRGGGRKVGQLASRSPHRPNPIGLSLIKVERWDEKNRQLHVSGLDLVNGSPVYDIKPCVPWDIPGYPTYYSPALKVPTWVSQADAIADVTFTASAISQLQEMVSTERLAPLYTDKNLGYSGALKTLREVLAQDPRSSHKGLKTNARGTLSVAERAKATSDSVKGYRLIFCQCQVEFVVVEQGVQVIEITAVNFDQDSYVDGVPLISKAIQLK
jgi:tRNA-Thr(GGU) m(6)t(6)A37 methyltransferase TsaA